MITTLTAQVGGFDLWQSLQNGLTQLADFLPRLLGALLILIIGYFIARLIRKGITKLLQRLRLDERLKSGEAGHYVERFSPRGSPSRLVSAVIYVVLLLFVLVAAIGTLGILALNAFMDRLLGYLPNVIAALVIFLVAVAIAGAVGALVQRTMGDTPTGRVARTAAPTLVMAIAVFMILTQLRIAPVIVTATYIALIGAIALGSALAFGLGGREVAAEIITSGYRRAQQERRTAEIPQQQDVERVRERAGQGMGSETMRPVDTGGGARRAP